MTERRVIVIGAGAAGLMAAGQAAELGADVLLLGKDGPPGAQAAHHRQGALQPDQRGPALPILSPTLAPTGGSCARPFPASLPPTCWLFSRNWSVPTVTERGGRVFPASEEAQDVVDALVRWGRRAAARHRKPGRRWSSCSSRAGGWSGCRCAGEAARTDADAVIVATGGASYPGTGSTGDGYRLAQAVGHTIVPIRPALVPLETGRRRRSPVAGAEPAQRHCPAVGRGAEAGGTVRRDALYPLWRLWPDHPLPEQAGCGRAAPGPAGDPLH